MRGHRVRHSRQSLASPHSPQQLPRSPQVFDGGKRKGSTSTTVKTSGAWYKEFSVVEGEITENDVRLMGATLNVAFDLKR